MIITRTFQTFQTRTCTESAVEIKKKQTIHRPIFSIIMSLKNICFSTNIFICLVFNLCIWFYGNNFTIELTFEWSIIWLVSYFVIVRCIECSIEIGVINKFKRALKMSLSDWKIEWRNCLNNRLFAIRPKTRCKIRSIV